MFLWLKYFVCLFLQVVGFVLFAVGFFPQKNVLPGFNSLPEGVSPFLNGEGAAFDKLIFIVVDALRADFMYSNSSLMHFLHSLIRDGAALPFTAHAHPPTVTLPRLKGITTGGTPSFIDAVFNVADDNDSSQGLSKQDSWLSQFTKSKNKTLHFYGDDTWLKLFPEEEFFAKSEGTDSFFVSDFTEVDNNVTRHLNSEIKDQSWDGLILHYLGLDHIGHKSGPNSVYMGSKQVEMDSILKDLYESRVASSNSTLLVIMGDHGMNELGNHGGSSDGETSPGLVLASPKFKGMSRKLTCPQEPTPDYKYFSQISQIDLVPTLSALFNFAIPINNLGVVIPDILKLWPDELQRKSILMENCRQFMSLLETQSTIKQSELKAINEDFAKLVHPSLNNCDSYISFLKNSQRLLAENSTNYLYREIWSGFVLIAMSLVFSGYLVLGALKNKSYKQLLAYATFGIVYAIHFHGSSLIEEEYQLWWLLTICVLAIQYFNGAYTVAQFALLLISARVIRSWSNSGQKFSTPFTLSSYLLEHEGLNWLLIIITYIVTVWPRRENDLMNTGSSFHFVGASLQLWILILALLSLTFKVVQFRVDGRNLPEWLSVVFNLYHDSEQPFDKKIYQDISIDLSKQFFYGSLGYIVVASISSKLGASISRRSIFNVLTLFLLHQSRPESIPIFMILAVANSSLSQMATANDTLNQMLITICFQHLTFFSMGNTNLLATVDLSNAYNGVSEYDILNVSLLTFISNFAGVIYWLLSQAQLICLGPKKIRLGKFLELSCLKVAFYALSMGSLVASCINLRYHLFIWSVFSPKLLYFFVWAIFVNVLTELLCTSLLLLII